MPAGGGVSAGAAAGAGGLSAGSIAGLFAGGASLLGGLASGKGGKGGSSQAELPKGFELASGPLGKLLRNILKDPRIGGSVFGGGGGNVGGGIGDALDFFADIEGNPDVARSLEVLRENVADPTRLTQPLFLESQERLAAQLAGEGSRFGGIASTGTADLVSRGLAEQENLFLNSAAQRQIQAAEGLRSAQFQINQGGFFPLQTVGSLVPGLGGSTVIPPAQFDTSKAGNLAELGGILGSLNLGGKSGGTTTGTSSGIFDFGNPSAGGVI